MTLIPAFNIGVWNAWIPMLCSLIPTLLLPVIFKEREREDSFTIEFNQTQKTALISLHIIYLLLAIYSIFLPLKLDTVWFYVGLPTFLLGLMLITIVFINLATTPSDKPAIKGVYRYSRHPMYLTPFLVFIGVGITSASWVFLLLSIIYIIMPPFFVAKEEQFLIKQYGDAYRAYMSRTPRWIGIPKKGII
ncbi:methyltransferase family protein [Chloroflexota bacterium]